MSTQSSDTNRRIMGIGLIFMLLFVLFVVVGGGFGNREVLSASVNLPALNAETATLTLRPGVAETTVSAGAGEGQLLEADIDYYDAYHLTGSPGPNREMLLEQRPDGDNTINISFFGDGDNLEWDVRLNPAYPLALEIDGDVGDFDVDLREFNLIDVQITTDVGDVEMHLPAPVQSYLVTVNADVGDVELNIPADAAVRVNANVDVGGLDIDDSFTEITRDEGVVGETGEWQTENFDTADATITIDYTGDVSDLTVDLD